MNISLITHCIIFNNKNQVLILKRSKNNDVLPNYWDIPGGTLEDEEDPIAGAKRETKEEAGIIINNLDLFFNTSNIDKKKQRQFIRLVYIAKYRGGKIKVNPGEHEDYRWIKLNDLKKYNAVNYLYECFKILRSKKTRLLNLIDNH
jgi:8-oxo-dGTP diphosphatase